MENKPQCVKSPTGGHFWKCEEQHGPISKSICKYCGAITELRNAPSDGNCQVIMIGGVPKNQRVIPLGNPLEKLWG